MVDAGPRRGHDRIRSTLCVACLAHLCAAVLFDMVWLGYGGHELRELSEHSPDAVVEVFIEPALRGSEPTRSSQGGRSTDDRTGPSAIPSSVGARAAHIVPDFHGLPAGVDPAAPWAAEPGARSGSRGPSSDPSGDSAGYGPTPWIGLHGGTAGVGLSPLPGAILPDHAPPAPTSAPRRSYDRDAAGKMLRSELRRRDVRLGLLPAAATATASALRVAVRSHTPAVSRGTFQARFDSSGRLVQLQVMSFSAGTIQQWSRAVAQARAQLQARTFAMGAHFDSGARVTVHTRSVMQYPSGDGRKPAAPKSQGAPSWPYTPKAPPHGRSFRTPPWGPPPDKALGRGDLSDIGARKRRIVYATVDAQPL